MHGGDNGGNGRPVNEGLLLLLAELLQVMRGLEHGQKRTTRAIDALVSTQLLILRKLGVVLHEVDEIEQELRPHSYPATGAVLVRAL
jgi:hypothetical protein